MAFVASSEDILDSLKRRTCLLKRNTYGNPDLYKLTVKLCYRYPEEPNKQTKFVGDLWWEDYLMEEVSR